MLKLKSTIEPEAGRIVRRTVMKNPNGQVVLIAFDKNTGLPEHSVEADTLVLVLEGHVEFSSSDDTFPMDEGDYVTLRPGEVHKVYAALPAKIMVSQIFTK